MAIFEVQMTAESFLAAQLNILRSRRICAPPPQPFGPLLVQVQRIEFGANSLRHNVEALFSVFTEEALGAGETVEGLKVQIVQPIVIHLAELGDILSRPNLPPSQTVALPCTVILDLDYYPLTGECYMALRYAGVEWGVPPPVPPGVDAEALKAEVAKLLSSAVASPAIPFTFAIPLAGGGINRIDNAGVTVDRALQRVVFRAERGGATPNATVRWQNFYNGFVADRLPPGRNWGLFIEDKNLESSFQTMIWSAVDKGAPAELDLISVGCVYSNAGGKANLDTTLYANFDLPDPLGIEYIEPVIHSEFSAQSGMTNTLVIDIHMPDLKQVVRGIVAKYFPGLLEYLMWPMPQIFRAVGESEVEDVDLPDVPLPACTQVTELHTRCSHSVNSPGTEGIQFRFDTLVALQDGLLLTGPLVIPALAAGALDVSFLPFEWAAPPVSCGATSMATIAWFSQNGKEASRAVASIFVNTNGTAPAFLCGHEVRDDPLGVFAGAQIEADSEELPARITIRVPRPKLAYRNNPYPLRLLVRTTAGTRLVEIPPVPALTDVDLERLLAEMLGRLGLCYVRIAPWFKYPHGFNPKWHVDPPWEGRVDHRWVVRINGLAPGESASLADERGRPLATVFGREGRIAAIDIIVPSAMSDGLTLLRHGESLQGEPPRSRFDPERALAELEARGVEIVQQLVRHLARVPAGGTLRRLGRSTAMVRRGAWLVVEDQVALLDLADPGRPRRAGTWRLEGVRTAFDSAAGAVAVTEDGLWRLGEAGRFSPLARMGDGPGIVDSAPAGRGLIHLLTRETLELRDLDGRVVDRIGHEGGRSLLRLGRRLAVAGARGIQLFEPGEGRLGRPLARADVRATSVHLAADGDADSLLALRDDGSAVSLGLEGEALHETATFAAGARTAGTLRIGRLLLRPGPAHVEIGWLGEEVPVVGDSAKASKRRASPRGRKASAPASKSGAPRRRTRR
jgi:hypothetical protein